MKIDFDKLAKGVLVFSLLLVALSVCYYYVFFLPQKEEVRIELQKQEQLADDEKERQALEQEHKEYTAKRRMECYEIYERKREEFNNVEGYSYIEICPKISFSDPYSFHCKDDSCEIRYIDNETEGYFRKYF